MVPVHRFHLLVESKNQGALIQSKRSSSIVLKRSEEFDKKVAMHRYGTGEARCVYAEVLNGEGVSVNFFDFNEIIKIRIYLECYQLARFTVNYMIRDSKNNNLEYHCFR